MNNGLICISVSEETLAGALEKIAAAAKLADVVEIRFDGFATREFDAFDDGKLRSVVNAIAAAKIKPPILSTFRAREQGGLRELSFDERYRFWNSGTELGWADFEEDMIDGTRDALWTKRIASHHDFNGVPENLDEIYERLVATGADVVKIAVSASDMTDVIPVFKLLKKARRENIEIIPIAMGESGKITRVLGLAHGAFMTYASLDAASATAPGQVTAEDLVSLYRAKNLDESTEVYGILGSNTSVSMSPYIHNTAFAYHGLNKVFIPLQTLDLDAFMTRMVRPETREIDLNFRGFSVTLPHKQSIIKHLDALDETAAAIGAVNTVQIGEDGKLTGFNTDAPGFIEPLLNSYGDLKDARVAMLGAGGAARACVYALKKHGANVTIFARDVKKAEALATEFGAAAKRLETDNRNSHFADHDIVVNATPLGMKGKFEGQSPVTPEQLAGVHLAYDLIYIPFQTPFMDAADAAEVPKIGGLAMLIAQALEQSRIWTGLEPPMKEMSRAALERLR